MTWSVEFCDELADDFVALAEEVQTTLLAHARLLEEFGPSLGRPYVDTLHGSRHANMKELRFDAAQGVWRVAFAFDPKRKGVLLVAADKRGKSQAKFYKRLIKTADARFDAHIERTQEE